MTSRAAAPLYRTPQGVAYVGDSLEGMRSAVEDESVALFFTSPPFALSREKEYGNKPDTEYVEWFSDFAEVMWDKLRADGSLVIDLGGAWKKGSPTRSLYQFKVLMKLCEGLGHRNFHLAQEFYWHNPSKMPLPAQWVNVERCRVKDSVNVIWWLSKTDRPKADNSKVLNPYSPAMERLLERQKYNGGVRPGGAVVGTESWKKRNGGAIPPNVFELPFAQSIERADPGDFTNFMNIGGSESASRYHRACNALTSYSRREGHDVAERFRKHPARIPVQLPTFFTRFLTDPGDLVVDPFAGSNVTGQAAEENDRKWQSFELHRAYLEASVARFDAYIDNRMHWYDSEAPPMLDMLDSSWVKR